MKNVVIAVFSFLLLIFSCKKNQNYFSNNQKIILTSKEYSNLCENLKNTPLTIKYFDATNNRYVSFDCKSRKVTFSKSWSFANPEPNTIYGDGSGLVLYMSSTSFDLGSNSSSYQITAGSTTLNVKTICVAVDASAYANMFAGQTGQLPIDGISIVMGLDADFSLLANSSSTNFSNYFHGLAYYLVYDFNASGPYNVIDWTQGIDFNNQKAFAMVFSFEENNFGGFYFSKDGDITVSGGDMTFNGNYWGIETDFSSLNPDLTYNTFTGSGTMGCE
jgi:hypothetical protein